MSPGALRHVLLAVYLVVCLGCVVWPGYALLGARIEPYVLGLPFSLAWIVGWIVLTFLVLVLYLVAGERRDPGSS